MTVTAWSARMPETRAPLVRSSRRGDEVTPPAYGRAWRARPSLRCEMPRKGSCIETSQPRGASWTVKDTRARNRLTSARSTIKARAVSADRISSAFADARFVFANGLQGVPTMRLSVIRARARPGDVDPVIGAIHDRVSGDGCHGVGALHEDSFAEVMRDFIPLDDRLCPVFDDDALALPSLTAFATDIGAVPALMWRCRLTRFARPRCPQSSRQPQR